MDPGTVRALVGPSPRPDLVDRTRAALAAAGVAPIDAVPPGGAAEWVWLLDGVTVPQPGALDAFAAALGALDGLPAPLVLAGRVLDASGGPHPDALPRHEIFEKELTVAAIERGLVQLRAAPSGSLLVRAEAFTRFGPPRTDLPPTWAAFDFTARVLRSPGDPGYLVPASVAVREVPPRPGGRRGAGLRSRVRVLGGPAWNPTERLWEGFLVGEAVLRGVTGPARPA